jgi:antirestriction protein ArdC
VFNVEQCDGIPDMVAAGRPMRARNPDARDDLADQFLHSTGADTREGHTEAYYVPSHDFISMLAFEAFKGADHFYGTVFHELTHWTAHSSRLDRDVKNRFGSRNYGAEELIVELGAAFLCAEFDFDGDLRHAGYIGQWIELLQADKRAFFTACSKASKAADYLRGLALAQPSEVAALAVINENLNRSSMSIRLRARASRCSTQTGRSKRSVRMALDGFGMSGNKGARPRGSRPVRFRRATRLIGTP